MRVVTLENSGRVYTSNVYLVLGDRSQLEDVNTLVDVGADPAILASIERAPTGIGKWAVEQVVRDTQPFRSLCAFARSSRGIPPQGAGFLAEPRRSRCDGARWGHRPHGRSAV